MQPKFWFHMVGSLRHMFSWDGKNYPYFDTLPQIWDGSERKINNSDISASSSVSQSFYQDNRLKRRKNAYPSKYL